MSAKTHDLLKHYQRFSCAWILHRTDLSPPPKSQRTTRDWYSRQLGDYTLKYHHKAKYNYGNCNATSVHALGIIMDVYDFNKGEVDICNALSQILKEKGWKAFYEHLKHTAGTYILFIEHEGLSIVLDATGTVPAAHGQFQGSCIVASHPRLIAQVTGSPISELAREWSHHPKVGAGGRYMPGLLTEFDDIEIITPNQRFDVEKRSMSRFYPDRELSELDPKDIAHQVAPLLKGQLEKLSESYKLAFSLSGGLDTRVTLAMSRTVAHKSSYFTYYTSGSEILSNDIAVARQAADHLGLDHVGFSLSYDRSSPLMRTAAYHDGILRATPIWSIHYDIFSNISKGAIHVRSNILEIARGFYSKNIQNRKNKFDAGKLSGLFRAVTREEFTKYFDDFVKKTSFYPKKFYNVHYTDLFYWEHRLGANYGAIYREDRPFFETYIIYNCRTILELMLSTSMNNRINGVVMRHLIEDAWPEALQVPIFSGSKFIDLYTDRVIHSNSPNKAGSNSKSSWLLFTVLRIKRLARASLHKIGRLALAIRDR